MYRSLPALWKVKSDEYKNRDKKKIAYDKLLEFYNKRYPSATVQDLKDRLNSLRTNFRTELKKIAASNADGGGEYKSTRWYFESLSEFLLDQESSTSFVDIDIEVNIDRGEMKLNERQRRSFLDSFVLNSRYMVYIQFLLFGLCLYIVDDISFLLLCLYRIRMSFCVVCELLLLKI